MSATKKIRLDLIELEGCQSRAGTCETTVAEYCELWEANTGFPPVMLFSDGSTYYCGDGHHRILGAERAGIQQIEARVVKGGKSDALLYSAGANASHGKRRTNADKRKAVKIVLELHAEWSDRAIADHCGVSNTLVSEVRGQVSENDTSKKPAKRTGRDGKQYPAKAAAKKISGGATFDVAEIEAASPQKKPKPGSPTLDRRHVDKAYSALTALIDAFEKVGLSVEFAGCIENMSERMEVMKGYKRAS